MIISNKITVNKSDINYAEILRYANNELVLANQDYEKKQKMGLWVGDTPIKIKYYEINEGNLILPFGCIDYLKQNKLINNYTLDMHNGKEYKWNYDLKLYNYQKDCSERVVNAKHGVFIAPAGSGKTQMFIDIILKLKKKALILVHTVDLLNQAKSRIEALTNIKVGTITAGMIDIQEITIATVQTLSKMDLKEYAYEWGTIVGDECHRIVGSPTVQGMFYKIFSQLKALNKIGCTATFHRADGNEKTIKFLFGDIVCEVSQDEVSDKTMKADIQIIRTSSQLDKRGKSFNSDGTLNFVGCISEICSNERRNQLIVDEIKKNKGKSCLVLSDRLGQLEKLKELLGYGVMVSGKMTSKKDKAQRERIIQDMREGKENVLFASYSIAREGLDIPILSRLFLASPKKDLACIVQSVGRIERTHKDKKDSIVYDFVDNEGLFVNMSKHRNVIYKKNKNKII